MPDNLSQEQQDALKCLAEAVNQEMCQLKRNRAGCEEEKGMKAASPEAESNDSEYTTPSGHAKKHEESSSSSQNALDHLLWSTLETFQNYSFFTAKNLEFSYILKGYEMFVSRKDKSITKSTVLLSFHKAIAVQLRDGRVAGPKKLGTFGASYLYPIFLFLGIITDKC